jgi:hypothetical protein
MKWKQWLAVAALAFSLQAQAQEPANAGRNMSPEQRQAFQKARLTKQLGVSEAAADSVMAINAEQREAKMTLARDNSMDATAKEAKFEELRQQRRQRLMKVMTAAQIDRLDEQEAEMRARRQERRLQ